MHRPPLMIFQSDDNSRHIREVGHALRDATPPINILAVGGGEFEGVGVFSFTFDNDDEETLDRVRGIAQSLGVPFIDWDGVTVELPNVPGALGDMAAALEERSINISSLLVAGTHGSSALVLVGVPEGLEESAEEALRDKGFYVFEDHHQEPPAGA